MVRELDIFYQNIKFLVAGHILNPLWHDRLTRRTRRGHYNYKRVEHFLQKYKSFVENLHLPALETKDTGNNIYSIWFQGEANAPQLVKVCFSRLRAAYPDRFIVLDNSNLWDYISMPDFLKRKWEEKKIVPANFSDICRVSLLYQHGGMWFDATDFLTSRVPQFIEEADLFMYLEGGKITPHTLIQSCFMKAVKNHPLFGALLEFIYEYWRHENKAADYFLFHFMLRFLIENNQEALRIFRRMPQIPQDPTHNLWFHYLNSPYSDALYQEATKDSFFQKTTFKSKEVKHPIAGSMADYIINGKIKNVEN